MALLMAIDNKISGKATQAKVVREQRDTVHTS